METRLLGVESAADGDDAGGMKARNVTQTPPAGSLLAIRASRSARSCPSRRRKPLQGIRAATISRASKRLPPRLLGRHVPDALMQVKRVIDSREAHSDCEEISTARVRARSAQQAKARSRPTQCDISTGNVIDCSTVRLAPPSTSSRPREWP